jgi:hypothetical protein
MLDRLQCPGRTLAGLVLQNAPAAARRDDRTMSHQTDQPVRSDCWEVTAVAARLAAPVQNRVDGDDTAAFETSF